MEKTQIGANTMSTIAQPLIVLKRVAHTHVPNLFMETGEDGATGDHAVYPAVKVNRRE